MKSKITKSVIILSGVSGSGKSTLSSLMATMNGADKTKIVSADNHFTNDQGEYKFDPSELGTAHDKCFDSYLDALEDDSTSLILVDNTNTSLDEYGRYKQTAIAYGVTPMRVIVDNINQTESVHNVPSFVLKAQRERLVDSLN